MWQNPRIVGRVLELAAEAEVDLDHRSTTAEPGYRSTTEALSTNREELLLFQGGGAGGVRRE